MRDYDHFFFVTFGQKNMICEARSGVDGKCLRGGMSYVIIERMTYPHPAWFLSFPFAVGKKQT